MFSDGGVVTHTHRGLCLAWPDKTSA